MNKLNELEENYFFTLFMHKTINVTNKLLVEQTSDFNWFYVPVLPAVLYMMLNIEKGKEAYDKSVNMAMTYIIDWCDDMEKKTEGRVTGNFIYQRQRILMHELVELIFTSGQNVFNLIENKFAATISKNTTMDCRGLVIILNGYYFDARKMTLKEMETAYL